MSLFGNLLGLNAPIPAPPVVVQPAAPVPAAKPPPPAPPPPVAEPEPVNDNAVTEAGRQAARIAGRGRVSTQLTAGGGRGVIGPQPVVAARLGGRL